MKRLNLVTLIFTTITIYMFIATTAFCESITGEKISLNESVTDDTSEFQIRSFLYPTTTTNSTSYHIGIRSLTRPIINTGVTQSGYEWGQWIQSFRNSNGTSSDDSGTLKTLGGTVIQYGHYNKNTSAAPITTTVYGINLSPYFRTGTISNWYDLYIGTGVGGGNITNRYAIYQESSVAKNYFAGSVGIGTTSHPSDYKLAVDGKIIAEEMVIELSQDWPDTVFREDYTLPSLNQVESYIKENKHLPDIPSAKEVEEEGLSMAEMMKKQMQKIEELTLYVIEQNKQLSALKKENAEIKQKLEKLVN